VEGEAQALICGRSWVFQRIGRLTEALIEAEKSLQLGEDIGWERNTVYCKKCMGRLYRMMAEQEHDMQQRAAWLAASVACIQEAIQRFTQMPEFGALHPEVGDCYSLLGRTYLVAGLAQEASHAVREAYRLITDDRSKDYLDLVILHADMEAMWGEKTAAERYYEQALALAHSDHPEISEMRARAYYQRGRNREALRRQPAAIQDFLTAAEIWRSLGEHTAAAEAQWRAMRLGEDLPQSTLQRLEREQATVRIRAITFHKQRLAAIAGPRRPRREAPSREYWEQLIKDAKQQSALEVVEW